MHKMLANCSYLFFSGFLKKNTSTETEEESLMSYESVDSNHLQVHTDTHRGSDFLPLLTLVHEYHGGSIFS